MGGEYLLPPGTVLREDEHRDTERSPALPDFTYRGRPPASCPGALVPKYVGGPTVRVQCSYPITATVGLCPRCSGIEAEARHRLREHAKTFGASNGKGRNS